MARSILVAVDDSADSEKAFDWALQHLYKEGDALHVVHVIPRLHMAALYGVAPVDFVPAPDSTNYETVIQKAEQFILDRFVSKVSSAGSCSPIVHIIKSEVDTESVGHVLCKKALELNAIAVVMASHNRSKMRELFVGSVCNYCTHNSKVPVVVIR